MQINKKKLDLFSQRYQARISVTKEQYQYYDPMPFKYTPGGISDYNYHYATQRSVPMIEVLVPEDSLDRLTDDAYELDQIRMQYGPDVYRVVESAQMASWEAGRERRIRQENPGVQLAWDKYQMMLKIAGG